MDRIVMGILAHVDAGKTSLSEAILYHSGKIAALGRVDHGDAYLDTDRMERERGITIFSKQAVFSLREKQFTLMDTPGHVDFSAEMERTLSIMDYAVLCISAVDLVQGHTETLWSLLRKHGIPTLFFVNKMDMPGVNKAEILHSIREKLDPNSIDFSHIDLEKGISKSLDEESLEAIAVTDEHVMEQYLEEGELAESSVRELFQRNCFFPVLFGSALKDEGITEFLSILEYLSKERVAKERLSGRVFKISKGENGQRLTHIRLTGGVLRNREELLPNEKVTQIRLYSGEKFQTLDEAVSGQVIAVMGLSSLRAGDVFGEEEASPAPSTNPVLDYQLFPDEGETIDTVKLYKTLEELSDEFPELHLYFDTHTKEIHVRLMGEIQTEILKRMIQDRYQLRIRFGSAKILYMESIADTVEGIGHFEPLRHYAEVHLLLEPLERGSGLRFSTNCPLDMLQRNWQNLVLTHLAEKEHVGVLTGSPITDMHISLIAGKAHLKHTEGGDFREATYRAVRQGLRRAKSILLEPYYRFQITLPQEYLGRAMTDISNMHGEFDPPDSTQAIVSLSGTAPVRTLRDYAVELSIYTRGRGHIYFEFEGYRECHNESEVIFEMHYDPDADIRNPSSSVFCAHGSGFIVPFDQVENYAQVVSVFSESQNKKRKSINFRDEEAGLTQEEESTYTEAGYYIGNKELEDIFIRTYGQIKDRAKEVSLSDARTVQAREREENIRRAKEDRAITSLKNTQNRRKKKDYLLVDGYNIIFSWDILQELAESNLDAARGKLLDILSNYQGYMGMELIVVFDAYRVKGHPLTKMMYHNVHVVYTKEAQTADQYIEQLSQSLKKEERGNVSIASSDKVVQVIVWSNENVSILSAKDLEREVHRIEEEIRKERLSKPSLAKGVLGTGLEIPSEFL